MRARVVTVSASAPERTRSEQGRTAVVHRWHGLSRLPEYFVWREMLRRCSDPRCEQYPNYGGRGISVCPEWRDSYERFLRDVGRRPVGRLSLDRIDNDGNYEPGNVRWATASQQMRNIRKGRYRVADGNGTRPLTSRQTEVLAFIKLTIAETGTRPAWRDISTHFGFASQNAVGDHLKALRRKGFIVLV